MTIYLDVVFLENILLNYIIIFATAIISKSRISYFRILISSLIGCIFVIINYVFGFSQNTNLVLKLLLSILMVLIAFKERKLKIILKQLVFFYLVSFTFGGITFMLIFLVSPSEIVFEYNHFTGTYPVKMTLIGGCVGLVIITIISKMIRNKMTAKEMLCEIEIFYSGRNKKIKSMIDSGNLLKEPISKSDVIIVEKDSLTNIVSENILNNISTIVKGEWLDSDNIHSYKLKVIPFSSLGNDNGILIGFKPDYIKIYGDIELVRDDILIGIYDGKLSKNNLFTSLIGLNVIDKGKEL